MITDDNSVRHIGRNSIPVQCAVLPHLNQQALNYTTPCLEKKEATVFSTINLASLGGFS